LAGMTEARKLYTNTVIGQAVMSNALILGPLQRSGTALPLFDARIPVDFPSPSLDHMEHKLSLDASLDLQTPYTQPMTDD
ncbi:hypothetical protein NW914_11475, partial [Pseudomonas aeruginosa]|nr:hypothetical protein [Pseudomonas aeruginosa]